MPQAGINFHEEEKPKKPKHKTPMVGVGVMIHKMIDDVPHVLLGKRKGSHGAGEWSFPGGHIDLIGRNASETSSETAVRETREETGLEIVLGDKITFADEHFPEEKKFYVTVYYAAEIDEEKGPSEPEVKEPNKCEEWKFFPINNLPSPLFMRVGEVVEKWEWEREVSLIEAIIGGGREFLTPHFEPALRVKNFLQTLRVEKTSKGLRLRKKIKKNEQGVDKG